MKSLCKILALGALAAASLGLSAQTIPASSLDSGSRATVAITPMTSSQVTSIVNSGIAAGSIAIPNQGGICGLTERTETVTTGSIYGSDLPSMTYVYVKNCNGVPVTWPTCAQMGGAWPNATCVRWNAYCPSGFNFVSLGETTTVRTSFSGGSNSGNSSTTTTKKTNATCVKL